MVQPDRTSSNQFAVLEDGLQCNFRVSSGWFDQTEPPPTTLLLGEDGLPGSFERVRRGSTRPNLSDDGGSKPTG